MWNDLSNIQKFFFILFASALVPFAPELILFADIGGIELIFSFLVLYYKPQIAWLSTQLTQIKESIKLSKKLFCSSALFQPKVYLTHSSFYCVAVLLGGSLAYCSVIFIPALYLNTYFI